MDDQKREFTELEIQLGEAVGLYKDKLDAREHKGVVATVDRTKRRGVSLTTVKNVKTDKPEDLGALENGNTVNLGCSCQDPWKSYTSVLIPTFSFTTGVTGHPPCPEECDTCTTVTIGFGDPTISLGKFSDCFWIGTGVSLRCVDGHWILFLTNQASITYVRTDPSPIGEYTFAGIDDCYSSLSTYPETLNVAAP